MAIGNINLMHHEIRPVSLTEIIMPTLLAQLIEQKQPSLQIDKVLTEDEINKIQAFDQTETSERVFPENEASVSMSKTSLQLAEIVKNAKSVVSIDGSQKIAKISRGEQINTEAWVYAARTGNYELFNEFLQTGLNINVRDSDGYTPLMHAIDGSMQETDKLYFVKFLIDFGADINIKSNCKPHGYSGGFECPVTAALRFPEILKLLIEEGADVNIKLSAKMTPLHRAAETWAAESLCILLDSGTDINAIDLYGRTALHFNCRPDSEITSILLERGADINATNDNGWKPLHIAYKWADVGLLKAFMKRGGSLHEFTPDGCNALHHACQNISQPGRFDVIKFLVEEQKMDINEHSRWYNGKDGAPTAFMSAIGSQKQLEDDFTILNYLLKRGANLHAKIFTNYEESEHVIFDSVASWAKSTKIPNFVLEWLDQHGG